MGRLTLNCRDGSAGDRFGHRPEIRLFPETQNCASGNRPKAVGRLHCGCRLIAGLHEVDQLPEGLCCDLVGLTMPSALDSIAKLIEQIDLSCRDAYAVHAVDFR